MFTWFPYTNFHELNLDWILKKVKEFGETLSDFSDRLKKVEDNPSGYELPVASDDVLGGVKAPLKTAEQDPKVYIDADGYLYAPKSDSGVDSVNGKHGAVTLTNDDVNAPSKSAFETLENTVAAAYSPSNIPPYPVTSVNGKTGAVVIPTGGGSYELPVATSQTLGGVMPTTKTSNMTQEVGVDSTGKLWVAPSSGSGVTIKTKSADTTWRALSGDNIKTLFNFDPDISFMVVNIGLYHVNGGSSNTDVMLRLYDSNNTITGLITGLFSSMSGNTNSLIIQLVLRFSGTDNTIVQIDLVSASASTDTGDPLIRPQSSLSLSTNREGFVICPYTPTKLAINTTNNLSIGNVHYECWYY